MQVWPEFLNLHIIAPATASSRSASSKTMNGALPPSSSETFFTWPAHWAIRSLPTSVEPVKPSLRTIGFDVISPPIAGASAASPVTIEKTPGGTPASSASAAIASAVSGVCSAGFSTIVQPTASAGADLRVGIAAGKFQGVMPAVTPIASREHDDPPVGQRLRDHAAVEALRLLAEPLVERGGVGDLGLRLGERLALLARRGALPGRRRAPASGRRGGAGSAPGPSPSGASRRAAPAAAASIARRVSAAPIRGTSAIVAPVAGSTTGKVAPESASTQAPST